MNEPDRPTVIPRFDVQAYAVETAQQGIPDLAGTSGVRDANDPFREVRSHIARGHYATALMLCESMRDAAATNVELEYYLEDCRLALIEQYEAKLGPLDRVPVPTARRVPMRAMDLDPQSAFLLAQMDGGIDLETLLDVSGMRRLEALQIVDRLLQDAIIEIL